MPPKKSDQGRKSDVSVARFVVIDEDKAESVAASGSAAVTVEAEAAASGPPALAPAPAPAAATTSQSTPVEKKEKEKDKDKESKDVATIEDFALPKSIITRLAKGVLPESTQIQANATLALTKSAAVFINYLATHANEHTQNANKKTIMPADVFKALDDIEFGDMRESLEAEFAKFNDIQTAKRTNYRQKVAAAKQAAGGSGDAADSSMVSARGPGAGDEDTEIEDVSMAAAAAAPSSPSHRAKKAKTDGGVVDEVVEDDAQTEEEEEGEEEEDEEEEEEEEEEDEEEEDDDDDDQTQDALEEREGDEDEDEAIDGDESD